MLKIINFIKNLKAQIKRIKEECKTSFNKLNGYYEYLANGKYRADSTFSCFYNTKYKRVAKKECKYIFSTQMHSLKKRNIDFSTYLAERIVLKFYKVKVFSDKKVFTGQAICFSSGGGEQRIIDYKQKRMLTVFKDSSDINLLLKNRQTFGKFFLTPAVVEINEEKTYIIEEYLRKQKISADRRCRLLLQDLLTYQQNADYKNYTEPFSENTVGWFCEAATRLGLCYKDDIAEFIKRGNYKKCLVHGDMSRYNMIFNDKKIYYIDYENINNRVFFYDALYYFWHEAHYLSNNVPYNKYIAGEYDDLLAKVFNANGVEYDVSHKKMYLFITLMELTRGNIFQQDIKFIS